MFALVVLAASAPPPTYEVVNLVPTPYVVVNRVPPQTPTTVPPVTFASDSPVCVGGNCSVPASVGVGYVRGFSGQRPALFPRLRR